MVIKTTAASLLDKVSPRAGPLIITVFGDTIAPRGGSIWLGSLIDLMQPLGLSERLVRTGVYRLAREGWLTARQEGRRSFYTITKEGLNSFAEADARIYTASPMPWNGQWVIVQTLPEATPQTRKKIRELLTWHGFGQLSPTMMIKPGTDTKTVNQVLTASRLSTSSIIFTSQLDNHDDTGLIVTNGWNLEDLSMAYSRLLQCFTAPDKTTRNNAHDAFVVRTLLIHQYRRILLKDPQLPVELLPSSWSGTKARQLVADAYHALAPSADRFIIETMQFGDNKCPTPTQSYHNRFSGS